MRRIIDFVISILALLLIFPLLFAIAISLLMTQGSPIFFTQKRAGRNGTPFAMFKFRTMHHKSEQLGGSLTFQRDPRITPLGVFLRNYKLDELPQLLNVLFGEMTLIGPRPEVLDWVEKYTPEQKRVLSVKPGLTDPVQLIFRNEQKFLSSAKEYELLYAIKVSKQLDYIDSRSFFSDLLVAFSTPVAVFSSKIGKEEFSVYSEIRRKLSSN